MTLLGDHRVTIPARPSAAVDLALRTKLGGCLLALKRALPKPSLPAQTWQPRRGYQRCARRPRTQVAPHGAVQHRVSMSCAVAGRHMQCLPQHAPGSIGFSLCLLTAYTGQAHVTVLQRCIYRYGLSSHARACQPVRVCMCRVPEARLVLERQSSGREELTSRMGARLGGQHLAMRTSTQAAHGKQSARTLHGALQKAARAHAQASSQRRRGSSCWGRWRRRASARAPSAARRPSARRPRSGARPSAAPRRPRARPPRRPSASAYRRSRRRCRRRP